MKIIVNYIALETTPKKLLLLLGLIIFRFVFLPAQDSEIDHYLQKITELQADTDSFYTQGMIPSERYFGKPNKTVQDNNIFFSALTALNLQNCIRYMSDNQTKKAEQIISDIRKNYPYYKNRNGECSYNFWKIRPEEQFFPNNAFFSKLERFRLADDLDDTSVIYLTKKNNDSLNKVLKKRMIRHTNLYRKKIFTTFKRYRNIRAYDSWFGEKMKNEFDVCVVSNVLLFVFKKDLPLNQYDSASVQLIEATLRHNDHLKYPRIVSPWYQNSATILYHFSRLVHASRGQLDHLKAKLIEDTKKLITPGKSSLEQMFLHIALYYLNEKPSAELLLPEAEKSFADFAYFRLYLFSQSRMYLKRLAGKKGRLDFKYRSMAFYYSVAIEYLCLKNAANKSQ